MTNRRQKSVSTEVKVLITTVAVAATVGGWAAMSQANATNGQMPSLAQARTLSASDQTSTTSTVSTIDLTSSATAPAAVAVTRSSR